MIGKKYQLEQDLLAESMYMSVPPNVEIPYDEIVEKKRDRGSPNVSQSIKSSSVTKKTNPNLIELQENIRKMKEQIAVCISLFSKFKILENGKFCRNS